MKFGDRFYLQMNAGGDVGWLSLGGLVAITAAGLESPELSKNAKTAFVVESPTGETGDVATGQNVMFRNAETGQLLRFQPGRRFFEYGDPDQDDSYQVFAFESTSDGSLAIKAYDGLYWHYEKDPFSGALIPVTRTAAIPWRPVAVAKSTLPYYAVVAILLIVALIVFL